MAIYENYFVGSFIHAAAFRAGFRHGKSGNRGPDDPIVVSLLQQTPLDQPLGDLFWGRGGRFSLIEFKTRFASLSEERDKRVKDLLLNKLAFDEGPEMQRISNSAHFLAIGSVEHANNEFQVANYSVLQDDTTARAAFQKGKNALVQFLDALLDGTVGCEAADLQTYLALVQKCVDQANREKDAKATASGGSSSGGSKRRIAPAIPGGVLTGTDANGSLQILPFENLGMLRHLELNFTMHQERVQSELEAERARLGSQKKGMSR